MIWTVWWVWALGALVLGILEVIAPAFILFGFAVGAGLVALVFLLGGPMALWLAGSLPMTLVVFAVLSLVSWIVVRRMFGVRHGQVKMFDRDINE